MKSFAKVLLFGLLLPTAVLAQNRGTEKQQGDDCSLQFVPAEAHEVTVVRPAKLVGSKEFAELKQVAGEDLEKLTNTVFERYFDFGLMPLKEIDSIITPVCRLESEHHQGSWDSYVPLILRAVGDNTQRFEMATHAVTDEVEFEGKEILKVKKPLDGRYHFACILDEKTIIWARRQKAIELAIQAGKKGPGKQKWVEHWNGFNKDDHFRIYKKRFDDRQKMFQSPMLRELNGLEYFVAGAKLGKESILELKGNCETADQAADLVKKLETVRSKIEKQLLYRIARVPDSKPLIDLQMRALKESKASSRKTEVKVKAVVNIDLKSLGAPVQAMYESEKRTASAQNMRQNALGMLNFISALGHFPDSVMVHSKTGKEYSWRIAILPYLGEQEIYDNYDFSQDWDSPHNLEVTSKMPDYFRSDLDDKDSTNASFFMLTGTGGAFGGENPKKLQDFTDGTSNTIMLIQAQRDVHWSKPVDIEIDPEQPLPEFGGYHKGGYNTVFADSSSRWISEDALQHRLRELFTPGGGEIGSEEGLYETEEDDN